MISASADFKLNIINGYRTYNEAEFILADGTELTLGAKDFMVGGCDLHDTTSSSGFGVGNVIGKTISISIANHDEQYSQYDFYYAKFVLYICMDMDDGTTERVRRGMFYVTTPATKGDIINFSAVDGLYKLDREYDTILHYPATLREILDDALINCGIEIGYTSIPRGTYQVEQKPSNTTYRKVVGWVCQLICADGHMTERNTFNLLFYGDILVKQVISGGDFKNYDQQETIDGGDFADYEQDEVVDGGSFLEQANEPYQIQAVKDLQVGTDDIIITGVVLKTNGEEFVYGEKDYAITITNNQLITPTTEYECVAYIGMQLVGLKFRILSATIPNHPLIEPHDYINIEDRRGNVYTTVVNDVSYKIGGFTKIQCRANDPLRNGKSYFSDNAQAVAEARKEFKKELSAYDINVQRMNEIAMNSLGFFTTNEKQPDGSVIAYIHDKKDLLSSTVIYKMTSDGFFVSTDGGATYTAGFDSTGNAVVNILSAVGIQFDWARGGTLSLGGFDNINGVIKIYNDNGVNVGVIDNKGMALYSDVNQSQIILSPYIGFVQRDADGNEFYGLIFDQTINPNKLYDTHNVYLEYEMYDKDTSTREVYDVQSSIIGNQYKYKWTYKHNSVFFAHSYLETKKEYKKTIIQLPEKFKDKQWEIRIFDNGVNVDQLKRGTFVEKFLYKKGSTPTCLEDAVTISNTYYYVLSPAYPEGTTTGAKTSPYAIPYPNKLDGYRNMSFDEYIYTIKDKNKTNMVSWYGIGGENKLPEENIEKDFYYEYDEGNGTITIYSYAYVMLEVWDYRTNNTMLTEPSYKVCVPIHEYQSFRVYVVC